MSDVLSPELKARIQDLARIPVLLVACDYDGTLAPIVPNPSDALPNREAMIALRALADLGDTHVCVISGRSLRDLATLSRLPSEIHLVGSHGSEFDHGFARALNSTASALRDRIQGDLRAIASAHEGLTLESKPASVAFHYRNAPTDVAVRALEAVRAGPGALEGVHVKEGKKVIELAVVETNKGTALDIIRHRVGAEAAFFAGDDVTDEDIFVTLAGPDLGIKVGPGDTAAQERVGTTEDISKVLAYLFETRRAWLEGDRAPEIERHSFLSDQKTVALVTPDARISWMCQPRADSAAIFAELVGGASAGYFSIEPLPTSPPISQRYVEDSMIVETRWPDITVTDYLSYDDTPGSTLVRTISGQGRVRIVFSPRLDYGRAFTRLESIEDGLAVRGSAEPARLYSPDVTWEIVEEGYQHHALAEMEVPSAGIVLELLTEGVKRDPTRSEADQRRATQQFWSTWASALTLPKKAEKSVLRSALTLKALCYRPTGSILAAATTSLPETLGGVRNWDYRYCWPRDGALSASALVRLGSYDEALAFVSWLLDRVHHASGPEQLRPIYPLEGDGDLPEAVLNTLSGYRGSRPVRIGNAAGQQVQLDVFGPITELVDNLASASVNLGDDAWELVESMVLAVERRWQEPDHGIWEERLPARHHVYSKVMCWQAVDRAMNVAKKLGRDIPAGWVALRNAIAEDVLEHGWDEDLQAFTATYECKDLDASVLHIGISGLLDGKDPRFASTVRAIERELRDRFVVYRYVFDDGLPGKEGGFLLCTVWLIQAYIIMGRMADARALFNRYRGFMGPTGLLAEQYDPESERMLGNFPQAYSHLGLINAALDLEKANGE